jgi:hypothetical protein
MDRSKRDKDGPFYVSIPDYARLTIRPRGYAQGSRLFDLVLEDVDHQVPLLEVVNLRGSHLGSLLGKLNCGSQRPEAIPCSYRERPPSASVAPAVLEIHRADKIDVWRWRLKDGWEDEQFCITIVGEAGIDLLTIESLNAEQAAEFYKRAVISIGEASVEFWYQSGN